MRSIQTGGAKLRNARAYALKNQPFFPHYREVYDLIEQLHRQEKARQ